MKHCATGDRLGPFVACLIALAASPVGATSPVCTSFNNLQLNGWAPAFIAPFVILAPSPGGPGGPLDACLRCYDDAGASLLEAPSAYRGSWRDLLCGEFCYDMKIDVDGGVQSVFPYFIVTSGSLRAQWTANVAITGPTGANPGWHHICAQLGPVIGNQLPSNNQGSWQMLDGAPNSSFSTLMTNVTNVYFPVDYGPSPSEQTLYDNFCLSMLPCSCDGYPLACLRVWREKILCKPGPGNQYNYSFLVTNFTQQTVGSVVITPPGGITISPSSIAGPFLKSTNKAGNITISGGSPGQTVCLKFTAYSSSGAIICCSEQCIALPECKCVQISNDLIGCTSATNGVPTYTFTMDNLSAGNVTDIFIIPTPATVGVSPQWFHYNSPVPLYGTMGPHTVQLTGAVAGEMLCLRIVCVNSSSGGGAACCSIDKCIPMPYCYFSPCCPGDCCPARVALVSQALAEMDGVALSLDNKTVTGALGEAVWIEEKDRTSGLLLLVRNQTPLQPGDVVDVSGEMATLGFTRALVVQSLHRLDTFAPPTAPAPLMMNNQTIGGANPNDFTFGVTGGVGLFNVGLLIRTSGRVTAIGPGYFYLDDGSALGDPTGNVGVRVFTEGMVNPSLGDFLTVTGLVVAAEYEPTGDSVRMIVPRDQNDLGGRAASGPLVTGRPGLTPDRFTKIR